MKNVRVIWDLGQYEKFYLALSNKEKNEKTTKSK